MVKNCDYSKEFKCEDPAEMKCIHCGKYTCDGCAEVMRYACDCFEVLQKKEFINEAYALRETDTLNYVTKSSTKEQRKKFGIGDIFINASVCLKCKDYIRSRHRHDFKWCSCKSIAVDGGSCHMRRIGDPDDMINVIETFHDVDKDKLI